MPNSKCAAFFTLLVYARSTFQSSSNYQAKARYLPEAKFGYNEYSEYSDNEGTEKEKGPQMPQWSQNFGQGISIDPTLVQTASAPVLYPKELDSNIIWDQQWPAEIQFGQLSAVSIDPQGNVAVFHRGNRVWGLVTFDVHEKFDREEGPIRQNTIVLIDSTGKKILEWGRSMFYLPHGLTIDHLGNYWITDVALHQVLKFDAKDIPKDSEKIKEQLHSALPLADGHTLREGVNGEHGIRPSLVLGEAFEPGNDNKRFCKPTNVAVEKNGDFFVSDGYCNSRIIKFNEKGERILSWGRKWGIQETRFHYPPSNAFFVPHALAVAEDLNLVFVADRENGRVTCFYANNGTFHREYKHPLIGKRIFSIAYNSGKIYLVNGPEFTAPGAHVRGYVIDVTTGGVQSQFAPGMDMKNPHDIAVSTDGKLIYVVELNPHKVHKFLQDITNSTLQSGKSESNASVPILSSASPHHETLPLTDVNSIDSVRKGVTATTIILSLVIAAIVLVALCVAVAAIVARCRKRGCLLTVRRAGMHWESDRRENFKLSNLLESRNSKLGASGRKFFDKRPNTRDFSKLNTEPETSDDENDLAKMI
ncbi:peptidyl-alpha-hydroxyglycine alpha-amidating lyase 1 [Athalia rosae]|uniref:peptidyl-alpha-hydroxyglycine alpha-amidating lyase 1 n=1 Tax=Athalia rosae TaxID=37344 RepID=UPI002033F738|nr:peptidyl-alpha-hydroxyglycine alpha-amidating lyase 1 [Athalia rosae]XP_012253738.2 peptidyl-alpha-hydroxyglycine alpha-amidating lyase 1 [Athalia rosae]XP_012253739.2 peptidyl-alpha-hydroxyglycine alpha-amidating lyase 1 [Athalia rosae]